MENQENISYSGEKFSLRWDPKDKIVFLDMWGDHEKKDAEDYKKKFFEFAEKVPGTEPLRILVDSSKQHKTSNEARKIYTEVSKHPRSGTSAICGVSFGIRAITKFIAAASRRKDIMCFTTVEEGRKWLIDQPYKGET